MSSPPVQPQRPWHYHQTRGQYHQQILQTCQDINGFKRCRLPQKPRLGKRARHRLPEKMRIRLLEAEFHQTFSCFVRSILCEMAKSHPRSLWGIHASVTVIMSMFDQQK
ncbi:hypothetical protein PoB_000232200 [Plakobranchus ocellatus]|uniref:Histone H2A/H2B/H3 domain-containing protein n=1 Tax=Plakobranchus ocellatus TaxID=259542 RepID=A0AAV3Y131_9GAST|nr:hypothetical protein PoB_000232200 [Plakobranchus ocellatus]